MNSSYFNNILCIVYSFVVILIEVKIVAAMIRAKQSLSQNRPWIEKKNNSMSENKLHFQSKMVIIYAISDYEAEFAVPNNENRTIDRVHGKTNAQRIEFKHDVEQRNGTIDDKACRKEIQERKLRWKLHLENPPTERIAKLKSRIVNEDNHFTLDEFCQAVAILYQRMNDDLDLEVRNLKDSISNPISKYNRTNFVIPFLLEEYPGEITKPVRELIQKELRVTRFN